MVDHDLMVVDYIMKKLCVTCLINKELNSDYYLINRELDNNKRNNYQMECISCSRIINRGRIIKNIKWMKGKLYRKYDNKGNVIW